LRFPLPDLALRKTFEGFFTHTAQLLKPVKELTDDFWGTTTGFTTYEIPVFFDPSYSTVLHYRREGVIIDGVFRFFAFATYDISGTVVTVEAGDRIQIENLQGEILEIRDYFGQEGIVLKEIIAR